MSLPKHASYSELAENLNKDDRIRGTLTPQNTLAWTILKYSILAGCVVFVATQSFKLDWPLQPRDNTQARADDLVQVPDSRAFNWTSISPSEDLKWTACYDDFECARFSVPLDYSNPKGHRAAVALVRSPSIIPHDAEGYLGPILFNPGGPGGSGVQMVLARAEQLRIIVGEGYDLVGFDPRGIGFTTPTMKMFPSRGEEGMFFGNTLPLINSFNTALGALYATAQIMGNLAKARMGDVAQHVSTPVVARDMLNIVKAHGLDKLQAWGASYGTVLGATFAAMFPDNVGRLVLDGVVDAENYYATLWSNNLRDTDTTLLRVYQACVDVGPLVCPIYESSAQKIRDRIEALLVKLRSHPITFYNATTGVYGQVDYSVTKHVIFSALFKPYATSKELVSALADLEKGIAEPIYRMSDRGLADTAITESCACPTAPHEPLRLGIENTLAIACGEGDVVDDDMEALRRYYDVMANDSTFAECWYLRIGCSGWEIRAKERFTASWETNTSYPILFIGNTADPVTPLRNAHKMSQGFKDSVVLTQNSPGHCSSAAASLCTAKAIRAYFQNGTLPKEGTVCEVQSSIFGEPLSVSSEVFMHLSSEDRDLLQASYELQQNYFVSII